MKPTDKDILGWLLTSVIGRCPHDHDHDLHIAGNRLECRRCDKEWYAPVTADPRWERE